MPMQDGSRGTSPGSYAVAASSVASTSQKRPSPTSYPARPSRFNPNAAAAAARSQAPQRAPSAAPSAAPSYANHSVAASQASTATVKKSGLKARDFHQGDIFFVPIHVANMDPNRGGPTDREVTLSAHGPVLSKSRPVVVLAKFPSHAICLPMYSCNGNGVINKGENTQLQHLSIKHVTEKNFVNHTPLAPLEYTGTSYLRGATNVKVCAPLSINYEEDCSSFDGCLTPNSIKYLRDRFFKLLQDSLDDDNANGGIRGLLDATKSMNVNNNGRSGFNGHYKTGNSLHHQAVYNQSVTMASSSVCV